MDPAIVIVHGAWHTPQHYQQVVSHLIDHGFKDVHCPRLPSAFDKLPLPPTANLKHDTLEIKQKIQGLVNQDKNVIVLMHSYGGVVGGNALEDLLAPQRQTKGLKGGVIHIIYMSAFVQPAGSRLVDPFNGQMPPWMDEDIENDIVHMQNPRQAFYNHVESDAEAQKWLDLTVFCPASVVKDIQSYAPYAWVGKGVDGTYLVCRREKELTEVVQEGMASLLGESRRMEYCDAGHCCMIGYGELIAGVVERAWTYSKEKIYGKE